MMSKYLNLFAFCKIIDGEKQSIICDFQKTSIKYIPNTMVEIINLLQKEEYKKVEENFSDQKKIFKSYIDFLIREKFAFFSNDRNSFIPIENSFISPEIINNSILEYNYGVYDIIDVIRQLDELNCKFIELRLLSFDKSRLNKIQDILNLCDDLVLRSIRLYIPFESFEVSNEVYNLLKRYKKVEVIVFYNAPKVKINYNIKNILFIKKTMEEIRNSNFTSKNIIIDLEYYLEAQNYNPYYNKKVCIDFLGNIKNCIKNSLNFGNVESEKISDIIATQEFQELWNANHNSILGLKNDEMRFNRLISNDLKRIENNLFEIIQ